jgi:hypothetical protein
MSNRFLGGNQQLDVVYHEHILLDCDVSFQATYHVSLGKVREDVISRKTEALRWSERRVGSRKSPQL